MIKQMTVMEVKINDRTYQFQCSPDSPLGEIHDALYQMRSKVIELMMEQDKKKETEV